ncbi:MULTISPECIES: hypothetical protein [unclassified Microcoleus]|uniref:hypothetical protein n=1 Tax=unclassified Microcoleus TaxID=2642155 RepID=UPI002FD6137F
MSTRQLERSPFLAGKGRSLFLIWKGRSHFISFSQRAGDRLFLSATVKSDSLRDSFARAYFCNKIRYSRSIVQPLPPSEVTMQITLSQEQTQVLEALVKHGQYPSLEEAINTALLLLIDDVTLSDDGNSPNYLAWVQETGKKIDIAREQAQRGELLNPDDVLAQLRDKVKKARELRA